MATNTAEDTFATDIADGIVFVDFWADWCGPCKVLAPQYQALSESYTDASFLKLDIMAHQGVAKQYNVRGIPTIIAFRDGQEVDRHVGAQNVEDFVRRVTEG